MTLGKSVWLPWRVFVMPGSTIGDGSVIGANSLVSGNIPPNSLAVGSPAKVIRSAPDFPKKLSEDERGALIGEMIREFDRFVAYHDVTVSEQKSLRVYRYQGGNERLHWRSRGSAIDVPRRGDTVLTETALTAAELAEYRSQGVFWLDLAGRTRSEAGSALTEELAAFIGRYGIRLPRDPAAD